MKWAVLVIRLLVGLMFVFGGASYFFMAPMDMVLPEIAARFLGAMTATHYFDAVKVLELLGGLLLLSGRLAPLGLVVLVPITLNIAFYDVFMMKLSAPPAGLILLVLEVIVMGRYGSYFAPFFKPTAKHV